MKYEVDVEACVEKFTITGRIDLITEDSSGNEIIWEIKCTNGITTENILQCASYMYAHALSHAKEGIQKGCVANLVTGECQYLEATPAQLKECLMVLLHEKYKDISILDDTAFLENCRGCRESIVMTYCAPSAPTIRTIGNCEPCPIAFDRSEFD